MAIQSHEAFGYSHGPLPTQHETFFSIECSSSVLFVLCNATKYPSQLLQLRNCASQALM